MSDIPVKKKVGRPRVVMGTTAFAEKGHKGFAKAKEKKAAAFERSFKAELKKVGGDTAEDNSLPIVVHKDTRFDGSLANKEAASRGGKNTAVNKPWREALDRAIVQSDGKTLRALAEALIKQAKRGDVQALKEIGDRLDGKAMQQVETKGEVRVIISTQDEQL